VVACHLLFVICFIGAMEENSVELTKEEAISLGRSWVKRDMNSHFAFGELDAFEILVP
jgi:hypothetical protein